MPKFFVLLLILVPHIHTAAQKNPLIVPLTTWHSYPIPNDSDLMLQYAWDTTSWTLFSEKGKIYAVNTYQPDAREHAPTDSIPNDMTIQLLLKEKRIESTQERTIVPVDDGYLIGMNIGEIDGRIVWYSKDGLKKYLVSEELSKFISFTIKDGHIYAIEGFNDQRNSLGSVMEFKKENDKWGYRRVMRLSSAPFDISVNAQNNFVIGSSNNIIEVESDGNYKTLYINPFWNQHGYCLYPESLLVKNKILYVGMKKGVFKYNLRTGKKEWLMRE